MKDECTGAGEDFNCYIITLRFCMNQHIYSDIWDRRGCNGEPSISGNYRSRSMKRKA